MDTVTQALLGAAVGQAAFGRRLGARAMVYGAVGGVIPDLDVVATAPFGEFARLVHHRGLTHSLLFAPVLGAALGYIMWRRRRRRQDAAGERLRDWIGLWVLAIGTHPLLDLCTTYGTQLLAPLSDHRFAINAIGIIDPLYTGVLLAAVLAGLVWRRRPSVAKWSGWAALGLTTAYLVWGVHLNQVAEQLGREQLRADGVEQETIYAYPTVLQLPLRRVVVTDDATIRVGYVSTLSPSPIEWFVAPRKRHPLIGRLAATERGQLFSWFAQERTTGHVNRTDAGLVVELDDIRYGLPPHADQGFWGVRATFAEDGRQLTPVRRFRRRMPTATNRALEHLWDAASGYEPCTFRVGVRPGDRPPQC